MLLKILSNHKHLITEGGWVFSGQLINALIQLAGIRIVTELLSADLFGEATLWLGIIVFMKSIAVQPFLNFQIRFYPEHLVNNSVLNFNRITFHTTIKLFYLSSIIFVVISLILMGLNIVRSNYSIILFLILYLFFDILRSFYINQLSAERKQRIVALWTIIESISVYLIIYLILSIYPSSQSYIISMASGVLLGLLVFKSINTLKNIKGNEPSIDKKFVLKEAVQFSAPFIYISILSWTMNLSSRYFIGFIDDVYLVGIFVAAFSVASRPFIMLSGVVTSFLRPILLQAFSQNDFHKVKIISKYWLLTISVIGTAMILILFFGSDLIANILLAKEYRENSSTLFLFIGLGYFGLALFQVFENFLLAEKRTKYILYANIVGTSIFVILSFILVRELSSVGAAIAVAVSFSIQAFTAFYLYKYK